MTRLPAYLVVALIEWLELKWFSGWMFVFEIEGRFFRKWWRRGFVGWSFNREKILKNIVILIKIIQDFWSVFILFIFIYYNILQNNKGLLLNPNIEVKKLKWKLIYIWSRKIFWLNNHNFKFNVCQQSPWLS